MQLPTRVEWSEMQKSWQIMYRESSRSMFTELLVLVLIIL